MIAAITLLLLHSGPVAAALTNGDFEHGLDGWSTRNEWYERPKGAGLAEVVVAPGEGRQSSKALKIVGHGKRGIALQNLPAYPGRYRVSGWIKCRDIAAGHAGVLIEWFDAKHKWFRGDSAVSLSGTQDWKHFESVFEAPAGTRWVHFDLLTSESNQGTAWFDDLVIERLPSNLPEPQAPRLSAATPAGQEGCLEVTWDPKSLVRGTCRLIISCTPATGDPERSPPKVLADSDDGHAMLWSLQTGEDYRVGARAVNADAKCSPLGPVTSVKVADRQPPRPGWLEARRTAGGDVIVHWSPHVLDADIRTLHLCVSAGARAAPADVATIDVTDRYLAPRPFFCTEPWVSRALSGLGGIAKLGAWCEDRCGNRGEVVWSEIEAAPAGSTAAAPCALWTVPPTEQVRRDQLTPHAPREKQSTSSFSLTLMRGQAKGFQVVVVPAEPLRHARMAFEPLVHEDGHSRIETVWLAYHFVNYVRIEKNSRATPRSELIWPGPAEYPDELSDDRYRDLPAGQAQPIYIRVTAPHDARPGRYRGRGRLESDQGSRLLEIEVQVSPVALPEEPRLKFVYWFSWEEPCKRFGVEQYSADGWRVLARLGRLMRAHHQNVAVVPWNLWRTWQRPDGSLMHDFNDFDRFIETFQGEKVDRLFCLSHAGGRATQDWLCPTMVSHRHGLHRIDSGEPGQIDVLLLLPAIQKHLEEKGWLERFSVHVADEPVPQNIASYRQLAARVRQAAPRLRRIDAIHVPDLEGSLEIFVPQLNYFEKWLDPYRQTQRHGNELWFYIAWVPQGKYPNRMIDSHAIKSRVLHWLNAIYDTTGYLHWALNHWQIPLSSLVSPGDQYIAWPSRRYIANSSLRYEAEREGLEDCELMFLVRDAIEKRGVPRAEAQRQMEAIARKSVRTIQDYSRSWSELEEVRLELLKAATPGANLRQGTVP